MVLQQKNRVFGQDVAAMPIGHFAALSVAPSRGRHNRSVDGNLLELAADSVAA